MELPGIPPGTDPLMGLSPDVPFLEDERDDFVFARCLGGVAPESLSVSSFGWFRDQKVGHRVQH